MYMQRPGECCVGVRVRVRVRVRVSVCACLQEHMTYDFQSHWVQGPHMLKYHRQ